MNTDSKTQPVDTVEVNIPPAAVVGPPLAVQAKLAAEVGTAKTKSPASIARANTIPQTLIIVFFIDFF